MPTTTNFGWTTPADTDLVKDGAAAIRTLGNGVDSSFLDLKGGTSGQILAKNSNTDLDFVWVANDQGDITAVTAGTGISGGGTSGAVTITNSMATAIDAKGDLIVGTGADAFSRLAVGATNGMVLTVDSGEPTGLKYATPSGGGGLTQLETGTLSGASVTTGTLSTSYKHLQIVLRAYEPANDGADLLLRFNGNSSNDYTEKTSGGDLGFTRASHNECFVLQDNSVNTGLAVLTIWDYANTETLKVLQRNFQSSNLSSNPATVYMTTGVLSTFNSTAAITSLTFLAASGNMTTGTYIIYGVS